MSRRPGQGTGAVSRPGESVGGGRPLVPGAAMMVPTLMALGVAAPLIIPSFRAHPVLRPTFLGAAAVLLVWTAWLYHSARAERRTLRLEILLKTPHWVQTCAQGALLVYWAWYVSGVVANLPFLFAQLLFAYGLDALLQWSRRDTYQLGFGPIPIVLSINFFLWFKPDWYYWQFVIIALGYAAKNFIHWERDGRRRHVFNPSSFPLGVFSAVLIVTGTTDVTLGPEIAQTLFNPPNIYWVVFLVALPGQILFGVTTMTVSAVLATCAWSLLYFGVTGTYFFQDAFIPIAVFLGMHLLFTDPATSPSTETGRVLFGVLYAALTVVFAVLLAAIGAPIFYDKLLPIPILNAMVRRIDRVGVAAANRMPEFLLSFERALDPLRRRLAVVGLWVSIFLGMNAVGVVGDDHPGQYLPFWQNACAAGSTRACSYAAFMKSTYCARGSGWACNELGVQWATMDGAFGRARQAVDRACELGFEAGCENARRIAADRRELVRAGPPLEELPIVLRGSKGPVAERGVTELYKLACERGWPDTCERVGLTES